MHAHRRTEMLHRFLAEGIACHGTWSALRNADGIRTRVAKGKSKHGRCRREMLEGKSLEEASNEPRRTDTGIRRYNERGKVVSCIAFR